MYTTLAHEVQKAIIQERREKASRPQPAPPPHQRRRTHTHLARRAVIAVILAVAAWTLAGASSALAAGSTLYVSSSASSDPACGLASQSNPFATIAGALGCAANGSTISVGAGSFAGGFTIAHNVVLQGAGAGTVINSDPAARLESVTEVTVAGGHNVTLKSLTVDGGVRQHDVVAGSGSLMVVNSTITGGVADHGGAINVSPAIGTTAKLTVLRSTIANNLAFSDGGGIYVADAPGANARNLVSVIDSTITQNQANSAGGAIKVGLLGSLTVRDSTIARNQATQFGGGLWAQAAGPGGNGSASVALTNTILAANTADATPDCQVTQGVTDGGHNLIGALDNSCPGITNGVNGDQAGTPASPLDPALGQLASNGGPTQTLALRLGSPAIGAGDRADCQATPVSGTDQRNQKRNANTRLVCDTGAYDTGGH